MKRGVFDTLRRGIDNTIANWPLILIRLAETLVFVMLAILAVIVIILPIIVSAGIQMANVGSIDDAVSALEALSTQWLLLVWIVVAVLVLFLVFVAIHAFVEAGCARVYVDAERIAGPAVEGPRQRFAVFSMSRWMEGATDGWWELFLVYNATWGLASLFLLIPLVPTLALMLVFREQPGALIASGCIGLVLTAMLLLVVAVLTGMWTNRSIASWAVRRSGAGDALSSGWNAVRRDFGRHLLITLAVIVVGLAGSAFFGSFSFFAGIGEVFGREHGVTTFITLPLRLLVSVFSSAFSAAVTSWYLAAYAALAVENR